MSDNEQVKNAGDNSKVDPAAAKLQSRVQGGLNTLTGGAWNRVRNAPIVGKPAKNAEQKIVSKGGRWRGRNHQRPNIGAQPQGNQSNQGDNAQGTPIATSNNNQQNDVGSQNLKKSLDNRVKNSKKKRNKRKKETSNDPQNSESSESSTSETTTSPNENEDDKSSKNGMAKFKRKLLIKVAIGGFIAFGFYVFFMIIAAVVTGGKSLQSTPFIASSTYNTSEFESITTEDSSLHKDEIAYYEKLKNAEEEDDGTVNFNYVNTILMQLYYEENHKVEEKLEETGGIDFAKIKDSVDDVVKAIKDTNSTDYSVGGPIYNAILSNSEVKNHYKSVVGTKGSNGKTVTMDDIVTRAFELAADLDQEATDKGTVITTDTKVVVETKTENQTQTQNQPKAAAITINEYLADSIYANSATLTADTVKAYTIAYSTNLAAQNNKLSIDSNTATASNDMCSVKLGCSYDENGTLVSGGSTQSSKNTAFYNGKYYYKKPLESTEITTLNNNINSVFGNVLVNSDGTYPTVDVNKLSSSSNSSDYKAILNNGFSNSNLKNIGEDSYILDGSYGIDKVKKSVIFYDQNDYSGVYCGKQNTSFARSGCGATSMAIIASTYENNKKFDPIYMMGEARKKGYCGGGIAGTSPAFFKKQANDMSYKYYAASKYSKKDLNLVLKHLSQEHLVVVHMNAGSFTSGGHYMVLGGVDPATKKVYVYDPYNKVNSSYRKTGSGWYSFNDVIVKEARSFYIIWKG